MKQILFLAAVISLGFLSCNKEQLEPAGSKKIVKNTENPTKLFPCSPWRDVADATAAAVDLNQVGICNILECSSGSTYTYSNNKVVRNSSGYAWEFLAYTTVTIADQNAIWSNAVSQATAAAPAGYGLSRLSNFRTEIGSGIYLVYIIKFDVTYIKCTGGGGIES